jgi:UPF0716 protein FxsA
MLPVLLILFILVPIAELYVIIQVGQAIGVLPTIAILVADSILGALLLRAQGRAAWRRFNAAVSEGRIPSREVLDGVLVIAGGLALLTPGFLTDIVGVVFLLPPTRALIRRVFLGRLAARMALTGASWGAGRVAGRFSPDARQAYDVDGTASERPQGRLRG